MTVHPPHVVGRRRGKNERGHRHGVYCPNVHVSRIFHTGDARAQRESLSLWSGRGAMFRRGVRQGTTPLSLYLHHEHSKVLLDGVFTFEANDGTRQRPKPFFM
jgi:hypothetical protein